ncbi:hypothetical protein ATPR_2913 [Acetobacter tropicalis NBRC 101654]|nr:hypothetical protein ATPR_2913 [Acetobacter tropicalis NBRC 101654]
MGGAWDYEGSEQIEDGSADVKFRGLMVENPLVILAFLVRGLNENLDNFNNSPLMG